MTSSTLARQMAVGVLEVRIVLDDPLTGTGMEDSHWTKAVELILKNSEKLWCDCAEISVGCQDFRVIYDFKRKCWLFADGSAMDTKTLQDRTKI